MIRVLTALALTLAVHAGCVATPAPATPACTPTRIPVDTDGYGDSLTAMARTPICQRYTADTIGLNLDGRAMTRVRDHTAAMARTDPGRCVVVLLGTNDLTTMTAQQAEWDALAALNAIDAAGARRVVWALLDERSAALRPAPALAETVEYNAFLTDLAAGGHYGDLLALIDWRAQAETLDAYLMPDNLHHTPAGAEAYASMARSAHDLC